MSQKRALGQEKAQKVGPRRQERRGGFKIPKNPLIPFVHQTQGKPLAMKEFAPFSQKGNANLEPAAIGPTNVLDVVQTTRQTNAPASKNEPSWTKSFSDIRIDIENHPTHSPINVHNLLEELVNYDNTEVAHELAHGFTEGFRLGFLGPREPRSSKNLQSIHANEDVAQQKINTEISLGRISGPHEHVPLANFTSSPIGLVPKKDAGKFRLIHHLSWPEGKSINDSIDPEKCTVKYARFDNAVKLVQQAGKQCEMAKSDISSAFRLLPVHPDDYELIGFTFKGQYYFDKAMPMGCSVSCSTWEKFGTFLEWLVRRYSPAGTLLHYIDDFLFVGQKGTTECMTLMDKFHEVCQCLGVPIAPEKTEGPTTELVFLGLKLNSRDQTVTIPKDKLIKLRSSLQTMLGRKKCTLKEIQSLIGSLNFACRAIAPGRAFLRRLIGSIKNLTKPHFRMRVTQDMKADMAMWLEFLENHNGVSLFKDAQWFSNADLELFTDSAASIGLGIYLNGKWAQAKWGNNFTQECSNNNITFLEYFPILVSLHIFRQEMSNKKVIFHCDNAAVVEIINSQTSKCPRVMDLVRPFVLKCLQLNTVVRAKHIQGIHNTIADSISRFDMQQFRALAPEAEAEPIPIPPQLWRL